MTVVDVLAALLTGAPLTVAELRADPEGLRRRYGLSAEDLALISRVPDAAYARVAGDVAEKHRVVIALALPGTVTEVLARHRAVLLEYVSGTVRPAHPDDPVGAVRSATAFLEFAEGRLPSGLLAFGRFELERYRLGLDEVAVQAARHWYETGRQQVAALDAEAVERGVPVVPATVVVIDLDHDVTAPGAPGTVPSVPVSVALQRTWQEPVRAFRLDSGTRELLRKCDGTRTGEQAASAAGAGPQEGGAALLALARSGLLVMARNPVR
ncbi:hypothetical protein [Streptomyces sp. NPDC057939]|uniref:hypothetical protein n=1 Tax=Streptomyces sp. NPDC057939 TaxID=3346284 RepID=UPI0036E0DD8E